jgi:hypothetical protein
LTPSPVGSPPALSLANVYSGWPFHVTWPEGSLASVPLTPGPAVGVPAAISGGHTVAHPPVHALAVAPAWSLSNVYSGLPDESASTIPFAVDRAVTVAAEEPWEAGWPVDTEDDFELLEHAAMTTTTATPTTTRPIDLLKI